MTTALDTEQPEAGPSTATLGLGPTPYHDSSQYRHWRFSKQRLGEIRQTLNTKAQEIPEKNMQLEKEAQISLGHEFTAPPPPTAYLTVEEELLLVRYYCHLTAQVVREFGKPEKVEYTAVAYLKRFFLKNSVMEWHPKVVMPTCVYLAAKTTNYIISMDELRAKFTKLDPQQILDNEFLAAQSLAFEFWVRGADKALRGWALDLQTKKDIPAKTIFEAIRPAFDNLSSISLTDAEFTYSPSQIALACLRLSNHKLVDDYLDWKYQSWQGEGEAYGIAREDLRSILEDLEALISEGQTPPDMKVVKGIDKRLKLCTNPEKIPGSALYIKRKQEQDAAAAALRAEKTIKLRQEMAKEEMVFGDVIQTKTIKGAKDRRPMSPRVSMGHDRPINSPSLRSNDETSVQAMEREFKTEPTGMGVADEAMGLIEGGKGLRDVGKTEDVA